MLRRFTALFFLTALLGTAVIIDRIAVVVGNSIIKDSDIARNVRVTEFLNNQRLDLSTAARKQAVNRLIDQIFIRHEIDLGNYPSATLQDADRELERLRRERFKTDAAFRDTLRAYGLTELELRTEFQWQLTALRFIDARFRPAVFVSDRDIEHYYQEHGSALRQTSGKTSIDDQREQIRDILTEERVNQQFFAWLDQQRKGAKIEFHEESLS